MKAKKYNIRVCEGVMDYIHGGKHEVAEVYIPELGLYMNSRAAFLADDQRANPPPGTEGSTPQNIEEIEVDGDTATKLADALKLVDEFLPKLRKDLSIETD